MKNPLANLALEGVVTVAVAMCTRSAAFTDYELWGYDFLVTLKTSVELRKCSRQGLLRRRSQQAVVHVPSLTLVVSYGITFVYL